MIPTKPRLKTATNYHEGPFPKSQAIVQAHSWHEILNVANKEAEVPVIRIEVQPERIRGANGKAYIPDMRYETIDGKVMYEQVKSNAGWERAKERIEPLLAALAADKGASYAHCSHEALDAKGARALVWIRITRWIVQYADRDLTPLKRDIVDAVKGTKGLSVFDLLRAFTKYQDDHLVAAICGLLHEGNLKADLSKTFNMATVVTVS